MVPVVSARGVIVSLIRIQSDRYLARRHATAQIACVMSEDHEGRYSVGSPRASMRCFASFMAQELMLVSGL